MPLPAMRAGKHDRLAYCVVVNLATKPEDPGTGPAPRLVVADCCPGCAYYGNLLTGANCRTRLTTRMLRCIIVESGGYSRKNCRECCACEEARTGNNHQKRLKAVWGRRSGQSLAAEADELSAIQETSAMATTTELPRGIVIRGVPKAGYTEVLTAEALAFVAGLERKFRPERIRLLDRRAEIRQRLDVGWKPDFLPETKAIRDGDWRIAAIPRDIRDRRVEITGPTDRKMVINALNCGANVYMADFEDATTPSWDNLIEGQANLIDAVRRRISFDDPETGRHYALHDHTAALFVRPRGWHLPEKHVLVDGKPMSGALFDFGLFFFHNARELLARGTGPYFYLPKALAIGHWANHHPTPGWRHFTTLSLSRPCVSRTCIPGEASSRQEPKVCGLSAGANGIRTLGPRKPLTRIAPWARH